METYWRVSQKPFSKQFDKLVNMVLHPQSPTGCIHTQSAPEQSYIMLLLGKQFRRIQKNLYPRHSSLKTPLGNTLALSKESFQKCHEIKIAALMEEQLKLFENQTGRCWSWDMSGRLGIMLFGLVASSQLSCWPMGLERLHTTGG